MGTRGAMPATVGHHLQLSLLAVDPTSQDVHPRFEAPDTTNNYNLFINLRNNNDYKFSNIFLIAELSYPNGKVKTDTLEYAMAHPDGTFLGTGFSDVKESKLWYKGHDEPFMFTETGDYSVKLQHAMRENGKEKGIVNLQGILDIGFRIEKTQ